MATPFNRLRPLTLILGTMGFFTALFTGSWSWLIMAVSFLIGMVCSMGIRYIYQTAIKKRALYSEPILCYLLLKKMIWMIEPETETLWKHAPT